MLKSLAKQWFLIALAVCFTVGYTTADGLEPLLRMSGLRSSIVFAVMWAMGVTLQAGTIRRSFTRPLPSVLAVGTNIAIVPLLCLPTMWLLPDHYFGGLYVAAIVPCTLASASVWTRKAGGDDSVAMMTTVVTNLACVAVAPLGIALILSQQTEIDIAEQVRKLSLVVVAPLILAQLMRHCGLAAWADRNKIRLSVFGQIGILTMVVFGAVASAQFVGSAEASAPSGYLAIGGLVIAAGVIHTGSLLIGVAAARGLGLDRARQIAVGIAGSQKTLMVGLQIAIDCGVSVVPMLVYHLSQLVIDTVIAQRWAGRGVRSEE